ncbi:uncharacterized protein LOC117186299 isoform X5 [Drosophila miranda]|uniref:uncharacterized protein LOC117186299 isoform X5 n=1 Tax=Drosophila miranda TaxID=7229 RepID=UPI00143F918B|nr:uncharacterized protein LOC117186299 isoform X5 [Drosophila miranda]
MPKEQFRASALNKKISHVQFGISGADEIQQEALYFVLVRLRNCTTLALITTTNLEQLCL